MGYGAVQLAVAGPRVFGPPADCDAAVAVALGITHIGTADFCGRHATNLLTKEAPCPYPDEMLTVTKSWKGA